MTKVIMGGLALTVIALVVMYFFFRDMFDTVTFGLLKQDDKQATMQAKASLANAASGSQLATVTLSVPDSVNGAQASDMVILHDMKLVTRDSTKVSMAGLDVDADDTEVDILDDDDNTISDEMIEKQTKLEIKVLVNVSLITDAAVDNPTNTRGVFNTDTTTAADTFNHTGATGDTHYKIQKSYNMEDLLDLTADTDGYVTITIPVTDTDGDDLKIMVKVSHVSTS
jgi:hypothetical protein